MAGATSAFLEHSCDIRCDFAQMFFDCFASCAYDDAYLFWSERVNCVKYMANK
jgi:hypothetical protein